MTTMKYTAEYGSPEFNNNRSTDTVLRKGIYTSPHNIQSNIELYHRTQGYTLAGSCARWTNEIWGVKIYYYSEGTTGGKQFLTEIEAVEYFEKLNSTKKQ